MVQSDTEDEDNVIPKGELAFLPERTCAICYQDQNPTATSENEIMAISSVSGGVVGSAQTDITNPYQTVPCGCIYCFACIAKRLEAEEGEGWVCLRCGELVKECKPWAGDVVEITPHSSSKKTVSFSDEEDTSIKREDKIFGFETAEKDDDYDMLKRRSSGGLVESEEWAREESDSGIDVRPMG